MPVAAAQRGAFGNRRSGGTGSGGRQGRWWGSLGISSQRWRRLLGAAAWGRQYRCSASAASPYAASQPGDRTLGWRANPRRCGLSGSLDSWFWLAHWVGRAAPERSYYKICIPAFSNRPNHRSSTRYFSAAGSAARITELYKRAFNWSRLSRLTWEWWDGSPAINCGSAITSTTHLHRQPLRIRPG